MQQSLKLVDPCNVLQLYQKYLKKLIFQQIKNYFTENKLLNISYYGFRKNHSRELAVFALINRLTTYMNNRDISIIIFLDLSIAFDTLNHSTFIRQIKTLRY